MVSIIIEVFTRQPATEYHLLNVKISSNHRVCLPDQQILYQSEYCINPIKYPEGIAIYERGGASFRACGVVN